MDKIKIPTSLDTITVKQYLEYRVFADQDGLLNDGSLEVKTVSIFCNIPLESVYEMKSYEVNDASEQIVKLFSASLGNFKRTIKIDGKEFGFIPDLEEISIGELMDCDELIGKEEHLATLMAVIYRPITKKASFWRKSKIYAIEEYTNPYKYQKTMEGMAISDALGALSFIAHLGGELLKSEVVSLSQVEGINQEILVPLQHLLTDGIGMSN